METIKIGKLTFIVADRYEAGHELNEAEAAVLNKVHRGNIKTNFTPKVEKGIAAGKTPTQLQADLDTYAEAYQFGAKAGGAPTRDPVTAMALAIAKTKIRAHLKAKKKKLDGKTLAALARQVVDQSPEIMDLARQRVEEEKFVTAPGLDSLLSKISKIAA